MTLPGWRDLYISARKNLDWLAGAVALFQTIFWRELITQGFASKQWNLDAFYSAAFDWSSIQAAFLFGVYAFFLSSSEPFLKAVASSPFFPDLRKYVARTLYLSMSVTVLSLPMLVAPPDIESTIGYAAFAGLLALIVYTFFCFLRVIRVFRKIERR